MNHGFDWFVVFFCGFGLFYGVVLLSTLRVKR
jgi:hypothetical protein